MKSVFTAILAFCMTTAFSQIPSYLPTNGLVAWYPFNGNANDESGNGNNGTVNGATLTTDRFGNVGKAYGFDGIDDYINCGNSSAFNQNNISVSVWVYHKIHATSRDLPTLVQTNKKSYIKFSTMFVIE
jgi:hypothetical protein